MLAIHHPLRLAQRLREMPFNVGRLKTGTPARIDRRSVDFSVMQEQPGDTPSTCNVFHGICGSASGAGQLLYHSYQ